MRPASPRATNVLFTASVVSVFVALGLLVAACSGGSGSGQSPVDPARTTCGPYPAQEQSPYVLPYPVGDEYLVGQGNCSSFTHNVGSPDQYAYDFLMPIGSVIVASRAGTVVTIVERYVDGDNEPGHENRVWVDHGDGTSAGYIHLTHDGALVKVGDRVTQGQTIALSGHTGRSTAPHLHFVVSRFGPESVPTTFRNTRPHPNGLLQGQVYRALPY